MNGILIPTYLESITTRADKSVKIVLGTQEISPSKAGELFSLLKQICVTYISPKDTIDQKEIDQVDKINPEFGGKTHSQRLRNTLFVLFQQNGEGFKDFDSYYKTKMDQLIEHFKSKIQD